MGQRFAKVIRLQDVQAGDLVRFPYFFDRILRILEVSPAVLGNPNIVGRNEPAVCVHFAEGSETLLADQLCILLHRPWPEGKTEQDMLEEVISHAASLVAVQDLPELFSRALDELHNAIDAFKLGLPFDSAQGKPPDPVQPGSA